MEFKQTGFEGLVEIAMHVHDDPRGWFGRAFDASLFAAEGLGTDWPQHSLSWNEKQGTLRGLHYQRPPGLEAKVVRCVRGALFDVVVDLRPESATFRQWRAFELADASVAIHIPAGFAHGFQTLTDDTLVSYMMSDVYRPGQQVGIPCDDANLTIPWPLARRVMSDADSTRAAYDWEVPWDQPR